MIAFLNDEELKNHINKLKQNENRNATGCLYFY